jgi:hypothetical protein
MEDDEISTEISDSAVPRAKGEVVNIVTVKNSIVLLLLVFLSGCISPTMPYNSRGRYHLHISALSPEGYLVSVGDRIYTVPDSGRLAVDLPGLHRGRRTLLLGIQVRNVSANDIPAILISNKKRTIRKLTPNDLLKLPREPDGFIRIVLP